MATSTRFNLADGSDPAGIDPLEPRQQGRPVILEADDPGRDGTGWGVHDLRSRGVRPQHQLGIDLRRELGVAQTTWPPRLSWATSTEAADGITPGWATTFHSLIANGIPTVPHVDVISSRANRAGTGAGSTNDWSGGKGRPPPSGPSPR